MTTPVKSALSPDLIQAARTGLLPARDTGWLGGFGNMLRKEFGQWWGTRTWLAQTLIWVLILVGISTIVALTEPMPPDELLVEVMQTFLPLMVGTVAMGTVITTQGALVGEKEMGTAAWVMSKPASRPAFILSKLIAYATGFGVTAILIPSILFVIMLRLVGAAPLSMGRFLAGLSVAALSLLFYLALTLMLGTFFNTRGPIAGIGIAAVMTGLLLKSFIPLQVMMVTPWLLPDVSAAVALGQPLPSFWFVPVVATGIWTLAMIAAALLRFSREDF